MNAEQKAENRKRDHERLGNFRGYWMDKRTALPAGMREDLEWICHRLWLAWNPAKPVRRLTKPTQGVEP